MNVPLSLSPSSLVAPSVVDVLGQGDSSGFLVTSSALVSFFILLQISPVKYFTGLTFSADLCSWHFLCRFTIVPFTWCAELLMCHLHLLSVQQYKVSWSSFCLRLFSLFLLYVQMVLIIFFCLSCVFYWSTSVEVLLLGAQVLRSPRCHFAKLFQASSGQLLPSQHSPFFSPGSK